MEPQNQPPQTSPDQQGNFTTGGESVSTSQQPQQTPTQQVPWGSATPQSSAAVASPQNNLLLSSPATFIEGGMPDRITGGASGAAALAQRYKGGTLHVFTDRIEFVSSDSLPRFNVPFASITQVLFIKKYKVFRFVTSSGPMDIMMKKSGSTGAKVVRPLKSKALTLALPGAIGIGLLSLVSAYGSIGAAFVVFLAILCFVVLPIYVYGIIKRIKQESRQLRTTLEKYISITDA